MIDRAGLEIRYTLFGYRGFESLTFRLRKEIIRKKLPKYLEVSEKVLTFAPAKLLTNQQTNIGVCDRSLAKQVNVFDAVITLIGEDNCETPSKTSHI